MDRQLFLTQWRRLVLVTFIFTTCFFHLGTTTFAGTLPCPLFPADNIWNARIDHLPVHPRSAEYVARIGDQKNLHPDFGSGVWPPGSTSPIGIPFVTVPDSQPLVNITFYYHAESDSGPYPIPPNAPIEGGPSGTGDRHVLVLNQDTCHLYEIYDAWPNNDGSWEAGSGAIFDLNSNALRPNGWTSADAAGLPILPGLIRYDEVAGGAITRAIRFTANRTQRAYVWPARHYASTITDPTYPPMGQRFRLKAGYDISGFSPQVRVILQGFKTYGLILADNGSDWFISGAPDDRWDNDVLRELRQVPGSAFEAVDVSSLMLHPDSGQVRMSESSWKSEIGIVNADNSVLSGVLRGFNASGAQVWTQPVSLAAYGRLELDVTVAAGNAASEIRSMRLDITGGAAVGYQKFYQAGRYRVGLEALPQANQGALYLPHIHSDSLWWTGVGLVNTTTGVKNLAFAFSDGVAASRSLGANSHDAFTIEELRGADPFIGSAQAPSGAGIAGLMLFSSERTLSGVSLSDSTAHMLVFPHVDQNGWWTGIGIYNPNATTTDLTVTGFDQSGGQTDISSHTLAAGGNLVFATSFSPATAWFTVESSQPVTGFELFGTENGNQLAGYSVVNLATATGVFPKLERDGWTGIAFVNPGASPLQIILRARNNTGTIVANSTLDLGSGHKVVAPAEQLFPGQDISTATYISFTATEHIVGFQLNGSTDGTMLDAIPALGSWGSYGTSVLYFPHIHSD